MDSADTAERADAADAARTGFEPVRDHDGGSGAGGDERSPVSRALAGLVATRLAPFGSSPVEDAPSRRAGLKGWAALERVVSAGAEYDALGGVVRLGAERGRVFDAVSRNVPAGSAWERLGGTTAMERVASASAADDSPRRPFGAFDEVIAPGAERGRVPVGNAWTRFKGMERERVLDAPFRRISAGNAPTRLVGTASGAVRTDEMARTLVRRGGVPSGIEALRGLSAGWASAGGFGKPSPEREPVVHVERVEVRVAQVAEVSEVEAFNRMLGDALQEEMARLGV
jgi:hypothetical protein